MGKDKTRWYDVMSLGIARAIRNTERYDIYKVKIYEHGGKEFRTGEMYDRTEYW